MRIDVVTIDVKPEYREKFIAETILNARGSVTEPGCSRWEVLVDTDNPTRFYLYEVYADSNAEDAHIKTPHFQRWEKATENWFATPYEVAVCNSVYPEDEKW